MRITTPHQTTYSLTQTNYKYFGRVVRTYGLLWHRVQVIKNCLALSEFKFPKITNLSLSLIIAPELLSSTLFWAKWSQNLWDTRLISVLTNWDTTYSSVLDESYEFLKFPQIRLTNLNLQQQIKRPTFQSLIFALRGAKFTIFDLSGWKKRGQLSPKLNFSPGARSDFPG